MKDTFCLKGFFILILEKEKVPEDFFCGFFHVKLNEKSLLFYESELFEYGKRRIGY